MDNSHVVNLPRRRVLIAGASLIAPPWVRVSAKQRDTVNILDYGQPGQLDWTGPVQAASATARRIFFPIGDYPVNAVRLLGDTELYGEGPHSVLRMMPGARWGLECDSGSPNPALNITGLYLHDLQLRSTCDTEGFAQHCHLLSLNGVSDVRIERVWFHGFRGDGLYLGSGHVAGQERHNQRVVISQCQFDGINHANRQGISVLDGEAVLIEGNSFENLSRHDMPGAIDFEPGEAPWAVIRNITVRNNRFSKVGGNVGVIAFHLPPDIRTPVVDIIVAGNACATYMGSGAFFHFNPNVRPHDASSDCRLVVAQNDASGGKQSLFLCGRGVTIRSNRFRDFSGSARLGAGRGAVRDIELSGNEFTRCGSADGSALEVCSADYLRITGNRFLDCGTGKPGASNGILFSRGTSSWIAIENNTFSSPVGLMRMAVQSEHWHVFRRGTNRFASNYLGGLKSSFPGAY
jgi:hypothetical protein